MPLTQKKEVFFSKKKTFYDFYIVYQVFWRSGSSDSNIGSASAGKQSAKKVE
jgi:hypothetical protein